MRILFFYLSAFVIISLAIIYVRIGYFHTIDFVENYPSISNILNSDLKPEYSPQKPNIVQIFSDNHLWIATLPANRVVTLVATGDVIPARDVNIKAHEYKNFRWPYEKTASFLSSFDITLINLETPLIRNCPFYSEGFTFCGSSDHVEGLLFAGVDVVGLANNHAGNFGEKGVVETVEILTKNNIKVTGRGEPAFVNIDGLRFGFLSYNDVGRQSLLSQADDEKIRDDIESIRNQVDILVVSYHWGAEYRNQPDARQKYLGHFTIDAGADLVIGNHPHWIQPIEFYKDRLITYAHGNFVFDQMWSQKTREGVVGRYTFYDAQLIDVEYFPVLIEDYGQPNFLEGEKKRKILDEMKKESVRLIDL